MSYDLMAFESDKAPKRYKDFLRWYDEQTEWNGEHDYNNPSLASDSLQDWYGEMVQTFPNMNLPLLPDIDPGDKHLADYAIGHHAIYVAFRWSVAGEAFECAKALAEKYGVGFFDVSGDGEVFFPDGRIMK